MGDEEAVFLREGSISFVGKIADKILRYVFLAVITSLVAPAEFSRFIFVYSAISLLYKLGSGNIERSISYFVPQLLVEDKRIEAGGVIKKVGILLIGVTIALAIILVLVAEPLVQFLGREADTWLFVFLAPLLVLFGLRDIIFNILQSLEKVRHLTFVNSVAFPLSRLLLTILLLLVVTPLVALTFGLLVAWVVALVIGAYLVYKSDLKIRGGKTTSLSIRELLDYSLPLTVSGMIGGVQSQVDILLLGLLGPAGAPALFKIAFSVAALSKLPAKTLSPIAKPLYSKTSSDASDGSLREFYLTSARWTSFVTVFATIVIVATATPLVGVLFDTAYGEASVIVPILALGMAFEYYSGNIRMLLEGTGNTDVLFRRSIIIVVTNVVLDVVLIPIYGITGAAIGTTGGLLAGTTFSLFHVASEINQWPITRGQIVYFISGGTALGIALGLSGRLDGLGAIIFSASVTFITYLSLTVAMNGFTEGDVEIAHRMETKFHQRIGWVPFPIAKIVVYGAR